MFSSIHLGSFESEEEAGYAYDEYVKINLPGAKLNNVKKPENFQPYIKKQKSLVDGQVLPTGILFYQRKYMVKVREDGIQKYIGSFESLEEAILILNQKNLEIQERIEKQRLSLPITRNAQNQAIIKATYRENQIDVIVDDDKFHELMKYHWGINVYGYAISYIEGKLTTMHTYLMNIKREKDAEEVIIIDHKNNLKVDNRLCNLRISTNSVSFNNRNRTKNENCSSKFIGVSFRKSRSSFVVYFHENKKQNHLGYYEDEEIAAWVYDQKNSRC